MFNRIKSDFLRNSLTVFTGASLGQVITFLASLVLARLYTDQDFGDFAIFSATVIIVSSFATGRYEMAIMLPKEQRDATALLALSVLIAAGISLFLLIVITIGQSFFQSFFADQSNAIFWLFLIPVAVLIKGCLQAVKVWSNRHKQFARNATGVAGNASIKAGFAMAWGALKSGVAGLIVGQVLGFLVELVVLGRDLPGKWKTLRKGINRALLVQNQRKYANFARINAPNMAIDNFKEHGIVFLLAEFFSNALLGQYAFMIRVLKAPVGLIGGSMAQVFFQEASKAVAEGKSARPHVMAIYKRNILIALPLFLILFFTTPWLFIFFFGEEWKTAGEIGQLLVPWLFLQFMASPVSSIAMIANKQQQALYFSLTDLVFRVAAIGAGAYFGSYVLSFTLISGLGCALLLYALYWYYRIAGEPQKPAY